jgi:ADP-sugar diphosphatase
VFAGVAAKEMKEETGLVLQEHELIDLCALAYGEPGGMGSSAADAKLYPGVYPSAGGCDEFLKIFLYQKQITREELGELQGTHNCEHAA